MPPEVQLRIPQEDEIVVTVSNSVEFFCFAVGSPVPLFHWEKDGTLVETEGRIRVVHGHTTSTLQIQSIIYEDAGNYSCIASNIEGEDSALFLLSLLGEHFRTMQIRYSILICLDPTVYLHAISSMGT